MFKKFPYPSDPLPCRLCLMVYYYFQDLRELDIGFHVLLGNPGKKVPEFMKSGSYGALVTDFLPLRDAMSWVDQAVKELKDSSVPICQVT